MKRDWKQERAKSAKHSRLMLKRPELREALYGQGPSSAGHFKLKNRETPTPAERRLARDLIDAAASVDASNTRILTTRETAQRGNDDGKR